MMSNFNFDHVDRGKDWDSVFSQIDANFDKVAQYLSDIGNRVVIESFTANAGQTAFTLSSQYNTCRNCLAVYKNGVRQWLNESFTETTSSSFELSSPCEAGDQIVAVYNKYYVLGDTAPLDCIQLESPNGTIYKVTVTDDGQLVVN